MKNLFYFIIIFLSLVSCKKEPEFFINGKGYYTKSRCVKDTTYREYSYHYGYNFINGKYEMHWGYNTEHKCLEYITDTIEVKK